MIKSLYVRVVMIFIGAVLLSLIMAFFVSSLLYSNRVENLVVEDLTSHGKSIIQTYEQTSPESFELFIDGVSTISAYRIRVYNENGLVFDSGRSDSEQHIEQDHISRVVKGGIFRNRFIIGMPLGIEGIPHAIFLSPERIPILEEFRNFLFTVLLIILGFGSLIILGAARYIVKPIRDFTVATRRIAQGDFTVSLITKRRDEIGMLTESINHMARELGMLDKMRQDFVANVSHEIQSPLTSISGFSKALKNKKMDESSRQHYLGIIEDESERLSRLSESLLQLSSLQYENHPFKPLSFRLDEQIRRVVIGCEPLWSSKQLVLDVDLEETIIEADEDQLGQVWLNVLGNSIKFSSDNSSIRIELRVRKEFAIVKISDNGIGIPEEEAKAIFEPFYKVDKSRERKVNGSGLGLSIAKRIIDIHSGTIEVHSKVGKGTSMIVKLPLNQLHL